MEKKIEINKDLIKQIQEVVDDNSDLEALATNDELTYQQKMFVINYCNNGYSQTDAARDAGYDEKNVYNTAYHLMKNPKVKEAILKRTQALQKASSITKEYVLVELTNMFEELRAETRPNRLLQLKTLELISKLSGFTLPENQINIQNNVDSIKIEIVTKDGNKS